MRVDAVGGIKVKSDYTVGTHLREYVEAQRPGVERALFRHLPVVQGDACKVFNEGLRYALFPGGKRLRPLLTLLGAEVVGGCARGVVPAAVAVEYLHTSSLIFDDLPSMDGAAERRGRATLHVRYGEGVAILVALSLMNASYGLILDGAGSNATRAINAHRELVKCIGTGGMIAGQLVDISPAGPAASSSDKREKLNETRNLKTSALIRLALRLGAILSGATRSQLGALLRFANLLGEAFQIGDDMLDAEEDAAPCRSATRLPTVASERGARDAERRISALISTAKFTLVTEFKEKPASSLLCEVADYVAGGKTARLKSVGNSAQ